MRRERPFQMATSDVVDLAADAAADDTDQANQGNNKGKAKSAVYEQWILEQAGKRDASHLGAQCILCKHVAEKEGKKLQSGGICLAGILTILAHVKGCKHHPKAARGQAETELAILRNKKKPAVKRHRNLSR